MSLEDIDKNISTMLVLRKITRGNPMKKLLIGFLKWLTNSLEEEQEVLYQSELKLHEVDQKKIEASIIQEIEEKQITIDDKKTDNELPKKQVESRRKKPREIDIITIDPRDIMESMGIPFLALSKNRKTPIVYESPDGTTKVRISCHSEHYIASIYDWDIIQCIAGKIQEVINEKKDIPPRTLIIPRYELFKGIHKQDGKKQHKDLEESLNRLQTTLIDTTIRNEDYRYRSGFSFLDNWRYTERKDIKEFKITLSDWLYDGICRDGALLKVHQNYFDMTSGLQKVLYRIARKHVGAQNKSWDFSIEDLHRKSGSERDLRRFKYDLKKAISDQKIPSYHFEWIEENDKIIIRVINVRKYCKEVLTQNNQPTLPAIA